MRKVGLGLVLAAWVAAACSSSTTSVDADAIDGRELAAVRTALGKALANDSFYTTLSTFVFPLIDEASRVVEANGDTSRFVGIQLDIDAKTDSGAPIVAQFSALLAWRKYRPANQTVDSVTLLLGAGLTPPLSDSLAPAFAPDSAGTGTGFVVAQAADSSVQTWLTRAGAFHIGSASYGSVQSSSISGITLTTSHGTMNGDFHLTAKLVPDSATTVTSTRSFSGGIHSLKIRVTGTEPSPPAPTP
jgi:hypothetical protein